MTAFSSLSMTGAMSGRGTRKSSKSAAGEDEHFPCAVDPIEVIAFAGLRDLGPILEIREFLLGLLRK